MILKNVASLNGPGDIDTLINITAARLEIDKALDLAISKVIDNNNNLSANMKSMNMDEINGNLTALQFMNFIDFYTAPSMELKSYKEIMFSGLHLGQQQLDPFAITKVKESLKGTILENEDVQILYGFNNGESIINDHINNLTGYTKVYDHWCFGTITNCHSQSANLKMFNEMSDITTDPDVIDVGNHMNSTEKIDFDNGLKWMIRSLRILNKRPYPFVTFEIAGHENRVAYTNFSSLPSQNTGSSYLSSLSYNITSGFIMRVTTELNEISKEATTMLESFKAIPDQVFNSVNVSKALLTEVMALKDPVCRGIIGSIASLCIIWITGAILQILGGIIVYKIWHYFKDRAVSVREKEEEMLLIDSFFGEADAYVGKLDVDKA